MTKHFVLLEVDNKDCPVIGVICDLQNTNQGIGQFKLRFEDAIATHFDVEDFNYDEIPDLFNGDVHWDIGIEIEGMNYTVRIYETWMY